MYLSRLYHRTLVCSAALALAAVLIGPSVAQNSAVKPAAAPKPSTPASAPQIPAWETISGLKAIIAKKQALAPKLSKKEQAELAEELKEERRELLKRMRADAHRKGKPGKAASGPVEEDEGPASTQAEAARLYRLKIRLGPGEDSLDQDMIRRAMQQRDAMKPAPGGTATPANTGGDSGTSGSGTLKSPGSGTQKSVNAIVVPNPPPNPPPITNARWEFFGPKSISGTGSGPCTGRVNCIVSDLHNPSTAYLGGAKGGVWKTTNGGSTWTPLTDNQAGLAVSCITLDPNNSNIVYVGTGDYDGGDGSPYGLLKSTDGGATWTTTGAGLPNTPIHKILIDPTNTTNMYAAAGYRGLYKSTNSGANWSRIVITYPNFDDSGNPLGVNATDNGRVGNVVFDSTNSELIVCSDGANDNVNKGGVYSSFDRGATWNINLGVSKKPVRTIGRADIAPSLSTFSNIFFFGQAGIYDPATLYVIDGGAKLIFKRQYALVDTTTGRFGYLWTQLTNPGSANWGQQGYDIYIATSGINRVFVGLVGFHFSVDGGATWIDGQPGHSDQHAFANTNGSQYLLGNDGGAWAGTLVGSGATTTSTVQSLNPNLFLTQFYFAAYNPANVNGFLGGTQDNSSPHTNDAIFWPTVPTGDGGGSDINRDIPGTQYTSSYSPKYFNPASPGIFPVYRTDDAWNNTFQDISVNVLDNNIPFLATIKTNLADPSLVYLGTNYLWQYNANTNVWTQLPQQFTNTRGEFVRAIATSPQNKRVIYTGTTEGIVFYSTDGGQTFTDITATLPGSPITSLLVSPSNSRKVYATVGGGTSAHLFRCDDASNPNWVSISGTSSPLPNIYTLSVAILPSTNEQSIYVGTDVGVFFTSDGGANWTNATAPLGLPNAEIDDLTVVPSTGYLMASTYGRGTWRLKVNIPTATVTVAPTLQGYRGDKTKLRYTISSSAGIFTGNLSPAGTFQFTAPVGTTYNFYIVVPGFLHKRVSGQYIAGTQTLNVLLVNGDVNQDNVIDAGDAAIVTGRLRPPGQRVNGLPDVDGDGIMTSNDLLIVQTNQGQRGD